MAANGSNSAATATAKGTAPAPAIPAATPPAATPPVTPPAAPPVTPPVALTTDGHASAAAVMPPPTAAPTASHVDGEAIGSAIAAGATRNQTGGRPSSEMGDSVADGLRNVRPRFTDVQSLSLPGLPVARVATMWQVSTGDGWWQDCSAPFASALESQLQQQIGVAQFAFFGNTRVGRIDYTHDLIQCQQFNHHSSQYKQIRRLTVTLGS